MIEMEFGDIGSAVVFAILVSLTIEGILGVVYLFMVLFGIPVPRIMTDFMVYLAYAILIFIFLGGVLVFLWLCKELLSE